MPATVSRVYTAFLESQLADAISLSQESDIVKVLPVPTEEGPPYKFIVHFDAKCLVRRRDGQVVERTGFDVGIRFDEEYLHHATSRVVQLLGPLSLYHPNVLEQYICLGKLAKTEGLVSLSHQLYEIFTYQNYATHDGLNPDACQWARQPENRIRFPLERRPLKRQAAPPAEAT
jgi:hypothetical protein